MGRFTADDVEKYGGSGEKSSFFSLKDDMDVARVRFMYNGLKDVEGVAVHEVEIDGKRRYVNCLRDYSEPKSKCPFCDNDNFQKAKLFVPLYNIDDKEVQIWDRGKKFFQKISGICARFSSADVPLCSHTFDIERHGKKGEQTTTYEVYETGCDNTTLEDLPDVPEVIGSIVLDKTVEDMEFFIENGYFPNKDGAPSRRSEPEQTMSRRTPATSRRNSEAF